MESDRVTDRPVDPYDVIKEVNGTICLQVILHFYFQKYKIINTKCNKI